MARICDGTFVVTNQRLLFMGASLSIEEHFGQPLTIQQLSTGLQFLLKGRDKPVVVEFSSEAASELVLAILSKLMS